MTTAKKVKTQGLPKAETELVLNVPKTNKVKTPKVKLISYEVKAIIPVGMYANIQPGIIVQAETLEQAERAVMPHIEALFAKYREGGAPIAPIITGTPVKPVVKKQDVTGPEGQVIVPPKADIVPVPTDAPAPEIPMSEPFNRAKRAVESAMSIDATVLIEDQVQKSVKLIEDEKKQLFTLILLKRKELNDKANTA